MRTRRKDRPDPVPGRYHAALRHDRHYAGLEARSGGSAEQPRLQSGLEKIDQDAGRAQARELEGRRAAQPEHRAQWQVFEIEPSGRDVLAEVSWPRKAMSCWPAK
jgi:hypothetical protein